jgi:hypothetical protein
MGIKSPPEAMVDPASHEFLIKIRLSAALQGLPCLERRTVILQERRQYPSAIGKEQSISHIKEDEPQFRHAPY